MSEGGGGIIKKVYCTPMASKRMLTARRWASSPSTLAICMTAVPTFLSPSADNRELVTCLRNDERLTPEYCLA